MPISRDSVDEPRVLALLGQVLFDRRAHDSGSTVSERALIADRSELLGHRVRGQQPHQDFGVMRLDAAEPYVFGLDRARGEIHAQAAS